MIRHYSFNSGDHGYCDSRNMFLACHVILQNDVIRRPLIIKLTEDPQGKPPTCQVS